MRWFLANVIDCCDAATARRTVTARRTAVAAAAVAAAAAAVAARIAATFYKRRDAPRSAFDIDRVYPDICDI